MARKRPPEQVHKLLDAAERAFCGYGRGGAQMSAVADEANVALGTLYHYFTGKESLLRWAMWRAFDPELVMPDELPIGPPPGTIQAQLAPMWDLPERFPLLHARPLAGIDEGRDPTPPLRAVVLELYDSIHSSRRLIDLVEAASVDDELLADLWFGEMVEDLVVAWADYLGEICATCELPMRDQPMISGRLVITSCTYFARLRHTDLRAGPFPDDDEVRRTVTEMVVGAVLAAPVPRASGGSA